MSHENTTPQPTIYKLKYPIKVGDETIAELTLRRPTVKELRQTGGANAMAASFDLVARLADVPLSTVDKLDGEDGVAVLELVEDFLPSSRKTGSAA